MSFHQVYSAEFIGSHSYIISHNAFYGEIDFGRIQRDIHSTSEILMKDLMSENPKVHDGGVLLDILQKAAKKVNVVKDRVKELPKKRGLEFPEDIKNVSKYVIKDVFFVANPYELCTAGDYDSNSSYVNDTKCNFTSFNDQITFIHEVLQDFQAFGIHACYGDKCVEPNLKLCKKIFKWEKCDIGLQKSNDENILQIYLKRKPLFTFPTPTKTTPTNGMVQSGFQDGVKYFLLVIFILSAILILFYLVYCLVLSVRHCSKNEFCTID